MKYSDTEVIILAAGKGVRMNSNIPKVLQVLHGQPMIIHILKKLQKIGFLNIILVVGYAKEKVIEVVDQWCKNYSDLNIHFATQEEQKGTGHAVLSAMPKIKQKSNKVLILLGDVPLIKEETILDSIDKLKKNDLKVLILTTELNSPTGYGRIVKNNLDQVEYIKEEKDATLQEKKIKEINTGIFIFQGDVLWDNLHKIKNNNHQNEYYLTDIVSLLKKQGIKCIAHKYKNPFQFLGVNSPDELKQVKVEMAKSMGKYTPEEMII